MTFNGTALTLANDASISGLTVGKGTGSATAMTVLGAGAGNATNTGGYGTFVGYQSGYTNTSGQNCSFIGVQSGYFNTTGSYNTALGAGSYASNSTTATGSNNTAIGGQSLYSNTTASNNTAVGYQAGYSNTTGGGNTIMGSQAGYSATTATNSVMVGDQAGYSTTGSYNQFFGDRAGYNVTTGTFNHFFGQQSGYFVTTGSKNTILGAYSGNAGGLDIRTASNYIVLSDGDGNPNGYFDGNGTFYLWQTRNGYYAQQIYRNYFGSYWYSAALTTSTPDFRIYNQNGAGTYMSWGATSWSGSSDARLKTVTGTYTNALADIAQIEPIKFTWKNDETNTPHVGVIAQSVQAVVPEAISQSQAIEGDDTEYLGVRYTELIPLMIASIQELKAEVDSLKQQLGK